MTATNIEDIHLQLQQITSKLDTLAGQLAADGIAAAPIRCHQHAMRLGLLEATLQSISNRLWMIVVPVMLLVLNQAFVWYWRMEGVQHAGG